MPWIRRVDLEALKTKVCLNKMKFDDYKTKIIFHDDLNKKLRKELQDVKEELYTLLKKENNETTNETDMFCINCKYYYFERNFELCESPLNVTEVKTYKNLSKKRKTPKELNAENNCKFYRMKT
jgi:hypothetical protein